MKKLMILAGMIAALLVISVPAFAQQDLQQPEEVSVTGVIEQPEDFDPQYPVWNITDEASGTEWDLVSCGSGSVNNFGDFVGERVTVTGIVQSQGPVPEGTDLSEFPLCVSSLDTAGEPEGARTIYGTDGYDRLSGTQYGDFIYGLGGGDEILEGNGNDKLYGGAGWDYIVGGYGNDSLYGDRGGDWLDGGAGSDSVNGNTGDDYVDGGSGNDYVNGGKGNDAVYGFKGNDNLWGNAGNDLLYAAGDDAQDRVSGGGGYDVCIIGSEDLLVGGCEEVYTY